jgi:archaellum component FlaC
MSIFDFKNNFLKKKEDSMQRRAEKSRDNETVDKIRESTNRINEMLDEIKGKKKSG